MSINNTQPGYIPTDAFIENNENESNIDQLLSVEVISTSQPSLSVTFNPINMIPSQTSVLSNIQPHTKLLSSYQPQFQQMIEQELQQQRLHREQHEQRQQHRRRYEAPEQHRYIGYLLRLYARDPERYQQHLDEQAHQAYLERRSPTFNEMTDEIFQERQLEDYIFEQMTPQERQEIWEQQQLNELHENPAPQPYGLPLDDLQ
jgi:hypothetical protein